MRIVLVSDRAAAGGAAIAATRLARALAGAGHEVHRIVWRTDDGPAITAGPRIVIPMRYRTGAVSRGSQRLFRAVAERSLSRTLERLRPDVINLHNLHNAVVGGWSDDFVDVCCRFAPVVWTLHDMWSFTGRCAYSGECERYLTLCDHECPTPREYPAWPAAHIAAEYRSRASALSSASGAISPSQWLADRARRGLWREHPVAVIRNGVDLSVFRPSDRRSGRTMLAVSHDFLDPRKQMRRIAAIASRFRDVTWLAMGKNAEALPWGDANVRFLGVVEREEERARAYASADALMHVSAEDNLPNTVVESIACGTPVVALDRGGVGEVVRPGVSGWLVNHDSDETLSEAVNLALFEAAALRPSTRSLAESELGVDGQAAGYAELFARLTGRG